MQTRHWNKRSCRPVEIGGETTKQRRYPRRSQRPRASSRMSMRSSSSSSRRGSVQPNSHGERACAGSADFEITRVERRRSIASLEQRRQVRYLTRHHPLLNHAQVSKIVHCAYSAVGKILENTYRGGDAEPDAPPQDGAFMLRYGVPAEGGQTGVPAPTNHQQDSENDRSISTEDTQSLEAKNHSSHGSNQSEADEKWISEFFNTAGPKLPAHTVKEMVAAGFKQYTLLHIMKTYTHKLELANYLATILRVTQLERDVIADLIMERRDKLFKQLKLGGLG